MFSSLRPLFITLPLLLLAGCLQSETVVTVASDGSGTIDETVMVRRDLVDKIRDFVSAIGAESDVTPVSISTLRERARRLGDGVCFVTAGERSEGDFAGYRARYAFSDVTRIRIGPSGGKPFFIGPMQGVTGGDGSGGVTFGFTSGEPASLVIRRDVPPNLVRTPAAAVRPPDEGDGDSLFRGMKVTLAVVVEGKVTETNAAFREGQRVTLVDIDMDRIASLPPGFVPGSGDAIPGLRAEPKPEVYVSFR